MSTVTVILLALFGIYAAVVAVYILLENRRPQATLAWLLILLNFPVIGLVVYLLLGRDPKAFSRLRKLRPQDLAGASSDELSPLLLHQDEALAGLKGKAGWLARLVRANSESVLVAHNRLEVLQNAAQKYPRLLEDIENARRSIYLQYFIWAADPFTEELKSILIRKARQEIDVRILYDPIGSLLHLNRKYVRDMRYSLDYELNVVIYDKRIASVLEEQFERDLADCTEFSLAEYMNRPFSTRLRDSVARLFSPLL